jgi:integrase
MAKRTLTDRTLKALKPAERGKRYDLMDSVVPGLGFRITETGHKSFTLVARFPGSKNPTRRALGDYGALTLEGARRKAREWLETLRRGVDPREEEERQRVAKLRERRNTFAAVAEDFINDKLPGERKGREVERDIRREFLPRWGKLAITQVIDAHVREVVKAAKDRGSPYQAHNLLTTARRLFSWAIDQRAYGLENSPCDRLKPKAIIGRKKPRTRILSHDELRALCKVTENLGYPYGPLFRMLALTGQRKSEVGEARWPEFDLAAKLWTIPAERMKADAAHVVPLTDDVIEILTSLPRFNKGDHLFSTDFGVKPVNGFSKGKARLDKAMAAELGRAVEPFVIHDIRRTMRTSLSALPVPDLVRELVIAHTKPGLHKVYDQFTYLDEKRHALELWAARLRGIVNEARSDNNHHGTAL